VPNPTHHGVIGTITSAQFERLKKAYDKARPMKDGRRLHPRDSEHPGHAAWIANLTRARSQGRAA
jgi:hypothetical protein